MPVLDALTLRFACDQSSRSSMLNIGTETDVIIYKGNPILVQAAIFRGLPAAGTFVDDLSNISGASLLVRKNNSHGQVLIEKILDPDQINGALIYADWIAGTDQHLEFELSDVDTNQNVPSDKTLDIYGAISISTPNGPLTIGIFEGIIKDDGTGNPGPPVVPDYTSYSRAEIDNLLANIAPPQGLGNVTGPNGAMVDHIAIFSNLSGQEIADSGILISSLATAGSTVNLTTNQNVSGVKTFASSPVVPDVTTGDSTGKVANTNFVTSALTTLNTSLTTSIGTKQSGDATLTALAGVTTAADKLIYATGSDVFATTTLSAFARTFLDDADAAAVRATLGVGSGSGDVVTGFTTSVDSEVALFSGVGGKTLKRATGSGIAVLTSGVLSSTTNNSSNWDAAYSERRQWDGGATNLVAATARTNLGVVIGTDVQAHDLDLDAIGALITQSYGRGILELSDSTAARTYLGVGTGSGDASTDVTLSVSGGLAVFSGVTGKVLTTIGTPVVRGLSKNIYIANRIGSEGNGTAENPFDGSTQAKFQAQLDAADVGTTLHVFGGVYSQYVLTISRSVTIRGSRNTTFTHKVGTGNKPIFTLSGSSTDFRLDTVTLTRPDTAFREETNFYAVTGTCNSLTLYDCKVRDFMTAIFLDASTVNLTLTNSDFEWTYGRASVSNVSPYSQPCAAVAGQPQNLIVHGCTFDGLLDSTFAGIVGSPPSNQQVPADNFIQTQDQTISSICNNPSIKNFGIEGVYLARTSITGTYSNLISGNHFIGPTHAGALYNPAISLWRTRADIVGNQIANVFLGVNITFASYDEAANIVHFLGNDVRNVITGVRGSDLSSKSTFTNNVIHNSSEPVKTVLGDGSIPAELIALSIDRGTVTGNTLISDEPVYDATTTLTSRSGNLFTVSSTAGITHDVGILIAYTSLSGLVSFFPVQGISGNVITVDSAYSTQFPGFTSGTLYYARAFANPANIGGIVVNSGGTVYADHNTIIGHRFDVSQINSGAIVVTNHTTRNCHAVQSAGGAFTYTGTQHVDDLMTVTGYTVNADSLMTSPRYNGLATNYNQPSVYLPVANDVNWAYGIYDNGSGTTFLQAKFAGAAFGTARGFRLLNVSNSHVPLQVDANDLTTLTNLNISAGGNLSQSGASVLRLSDNVSTVVNPITSGGDVYLSYDRGNGNTYFGKGDATTVVGRVTSGGGFMAGNNTDPGDGYIKSTSGFKSTDGTAGASATTGGATFKNGLYTSGTISTGLTIGTTTIASGTGSTKVLYDNSGTLGETDLSTVYQPLDSDLTTWAGITPGTGVGTALAVNVGSAGAFVTNGGALGTPSSGTVTNLSGTASININGTVGATTPAAGTFTTVAASGVIGTTSAGSVSAPSLYLRATNTGIYSSATTAIDFTFAGTRAFNFNGDGSVLFIGGNPTMTANGASLYLQSNGLAGPYLQLSTTDLHSNGSAHSLGVSGTPWNGLFFKSSLLSATALATPSALSATQFTGFASTVSGASIMGYGTTNDVSLMNRAATVALGVGPNTTVVNIPGGLTLGNTSGLSPSQGQIYLTDGSTPKIYLQQNGGGNVIVTSTGGYYWGSSSDATGSVDTVLSRDSAGVVAFGTATKNALGSWKATNGTLTGTLSVTGAVTQTAKTTTYNNIATEGNGLGAIIKATRVTAQTAANSSIATYTTPASDGSYLISGNINVTAAIAISTSLNCDYTDETNTARTMIIPISGLGGTFLAGGLATSTGPFESAVMHIRTKASTAITIYTAAGTFTSATYNAEGIIRQVQ